MAGTSPLFVGVDVGGTSVKLGLVRGAKILVQRSITTPRSGPQALQDRVVAEVLSLVRLRRGRIGGVGVGIPGLVEYPEGVVQTCANLRGWRGVPLRRLLRRRLELPVRVDNDVNVMALAEWRYGAGRGVADMVCMTLGTGVGGGLVLGGRLYRGAGGSAGEIGHMPVSRSGPGCSCGGSGCLERYVGNREIIAGVKKRLTGGAKSLLREMVRGNLSRLTPELVDEAARMGDPVAREAWREIGSTIGFALVGVVNLLNPDRVVIGGGISQAGRWLFEPIRRTVREKAMRGPNKVRIVPAKLGPSAGLIGAALLAQEPE